jgi:membrane protease YdiL (CAAX protease family)
LVVASKRQREAFFDNELHGACFLLALVQRAGGPVGRRRPLGTVGVERPHRLNPHLRGHLLLFDPRPAPVLPSARFLLAAVALEITRGAVIIGGPRIPEWLLCPGLLALSLIAIRVSGVRLRELGLRPWPQWSATEKSYFVQVLVIANVVFPLLLAGPIIARLDQTGMAARLASVFVPYLFFGFYQEVVYRGMLQSALERRLGAVLAVVVANVLFTLGPLHWDYLASSSTSAVPMLAAIFGIGLYFGALYQRSRNLWMPAVFHAIGNAYMIWAAGPIT